MYFLNIIKSHLAEKINEHGGKTIISANDIVNPPNPEFGDLSLPCFALAKEWGLSPQAAAEKIMKLFIDDKFIKGTSVVGPYLNFFLRENLVAAEALNDVNFQGADYGKNNSGSGKKVMVEFSNVNTHKEYHIGHLRNLCLGDAVNRILSANGWTSIPVSYVNDFGIHVAKTLWAYQEYYKYEKLPKNKGYFLGKVYVRACEELEKNEMAKKMVGLIMKKVEMRRGADYKLWVKTRLWSIEQFDKIYTELNIKFKHFFYESEFIEIGKELIGQLVKKGVLKNSEGAVIADLEQHKLGTLVFLRSDGTALYPVSDLPLAVEKFKKYKLDESIYIVDLRQSFYFKQLFKVLELMGQKSRLIHLGYEFVKLPDGMMSSRAGRVITYEDLRDQLHEKALEETKARHNDWTKEKIIDAAGKIAIGAMKFEMVKVGKDSVITFDVHEALRFEGYTSAYLQYTFARINSMLRKSGHDGSYSERDIKELSSRLTDKMEHRLIMKLADYPMAVKEAGEKYDPSRIARSIFDLAQAYNDYYHHVPVLKAEGKVKNARLLLAACVRRTVKNGLELLGIEAMNEM